MKRLIVTGLLAGLTVSGLCLAGVWSGRAMAVTYGNDNASGGCEGAVTGCGAVQPVWLADDPNDPNVPIDPNGGSGPE